MHIILRLSELPDSGDNISMPSIEETAFPPLSYKCLWLTRQVCVNYVLCFFFLFSVLNIKKYLWLFTDKIKRVVCGG